MDRFDQQQVEIPPYFLCPISLQIMTDPVTAITGITYDRDNIQKWLLSSTNVPICPVTNQTLSRDSDLIPNHTLRRLIQAWCTSNSVDRIPTPTSVLDKTQLLRIMRVLRSVDAEKAAFIAGLKRLEVIGNGVERNRVLMAENDVPRLMLELIVSCSTKRLTECVQRCLAILNRVWSCCYSPTEEIKSFINETSPDLIECLLSATRNKDLSGDAIMTLSRVVETTNVKQLQHLKIDFLLKMVKFLTQIRSTTPTDRQPTTIPVLQMLIHLCPIGRNRNKIAEAGIGSDLIELELNNHPTAQKRNAELSFSLLSLLSYCVEGRERLLAHPCGLALLAKRLLRVSPAVDDRIMEIIFLVSKLAGRKEVVAEMLSVGVVSKLCMVMQADCADYLKIKAREVLRMHWSVWNGSPCIAVYLLTMHHR